MLELLLFISLGVVILVLFELRARKQSNSEALKQRSGQTGEAGQTGGRATNLSAADGGECCGQHLVCERETLLQTNAQIEYFDDEELDVLAGINPDEYTQEQHEQLRAVFDTLQEKDVPAWCRSIQLRNIALPQDIREEALLICRERRQKK
jgi:hypothetical protein